MVLNQSEFNPGAYILPPSADETNGEQTGDYFLSVTMSLPSLLSQQKHYETLHGTQTGRDDLLFTSMIDPLFSFLLSMVGSRRTFSLHHFNILCLVRIVLFKKVLCFFHTLPKQMLVLNQIFTTVNSAAFSHSLQSTQNQSSLEGL